MKRYNLRANVDVDITRNLSARLDLAGILTRQDGRQQLRRHHHEPGQPRWRLFYPIFNEDGSMWGNSTFQSNIYEELSQKGYRRWYNNTTQGTFALTRKLDFLTKNLSAKLSFSYDNTNTPNASYGRNYAVFEPIRNAQGEITSYKQFGNDTRIDPNGGFSGGGAVRQTYVEATANWNRSFKKHNATAMLLWNRRLLENGSSIPNAYQSLLFRGTYNYNQKYLLELSASYQGSENFPKESRFGFFPPFPAAGYCLKSLSSKTMRLTSASSSSALHMAKWGTTGAAATASSGSLPGAARTRIISAATPTRPTAGGRAPSVIPALHGSVASR